MRYTLKHYRRTLPQITSAAVLFREQEFEALDQPDAVRTVIRRLGDFDRETDYVIIFQGDNHVWQTGIPHA